MTLKSNKLRDAIAFALCAASLSAGGLAMAQDTTSAQQTPTDQSATELDTITVTGTRIQSQTVTASSPVTEIQREEFQYTGATRTEDLVNQYPQMSPAFDAFTNNGALGYPSVDLRGLGPQRTLTLVNGFRLPPGTNEVPDISIVPAAAIKRVDLLTGGASAVYGSDAIAGVVNFILDDEFEGVSLSAGYSAYQHDNDNDYMQGLQRARGFDFPTGDSGFDGASRNIDVVLGSSFADGKGHAMAYASWRKNDPLFQGQRDYSSCALTASGLGCGGSATNATGNFYVYQIQGDDFVGSSASLNPNGSGSFIDSYGAPYNFAPINYYQRPDERYSFGTSLKYEINEHFRPYFDAMFINKKDAIQIAESGAFFTLVPEVDCANPRIGTLCSDLGFDPSLPVGIYVAKRNVEGGPRRTESDTTQWRVVGGVEGALDEAWSYNVSYMHGQSDNNIFGFNDFLNDRIVDAILGCPAGSFATCVPYDVFVPGGVTPEAAAALAGVSATKTNTELNVFNAYVSGDFGRGLPWVDEDIALVMGVEWRESKYNFDADTNSQEGNFAGAGGPALPASGKTTVEEVFLETAVPLFRSEGVLKALDLDAGYRLSSYDIAGTASTYKLGLAANFADQFRVRTGFNRAIRAPSVLNLFAPTQIALYGGVDPCAGATPQFTAQQCLNTGVPLNRYGTVAANPAQQNNQFIGGNSDLVPETAETFTFGVVYTPTSDLQFNADYYDIKIGDAIGAIGSDLILRGCGLSGDPFLCNNVRRNPVAFDLFRGSDPATSGQVVNLTRNLGELNFRGVDLGAVYRFDLGPGRMTTSLQGTYVLDEKVAPLPGITSTFDYDCAGKLSTSCQSPEWRHIANVRYSLDRFTFNLRWRYFGELDYEDTDGTDGADDKLLCEFRGDPADTGNPYRGCTGDQKVSAFNYFDVSASAAIGEFTEVTVGVNNVADKEPPLVGLSLSTNGNALGGYDQAGRYVFGSITFRF